MQLTPSLLRPIHGTGKSKARKAKRAEQQAEFNLLQTKAIHKVGTLKKGATSKEKKAWRERKNAAIVELAEQAIAAKEARTAPVREALNAKLRESAARGMAR